ncbi:MAG: A/G-specific adenine glycosylase [Candidatus Latescibacteria bacterium ADurb.Bin168]|nr:MAG: A/G-specific adenine glycosylase [Candidatus Latescibacteria bacterium ADurb.Bin168]
MPRGGSDLTPGEKSGAIAFGSRLSLDRLDSGKRAAAVDGFRGLVYRAYRDFGRDLPWRHTRDPYEILVSEVMLQQTQVGRVAQKYHEFLRAFPVFRDLYEAPLSDVLTVWQGMGYTRRAVALKRIAERVIRDCDGRLPRSPEHLQTFPGIGTATAGAICAYAYNLPTLFIETNIRRVFIHTFFGEHETVSDRQILPLVEETLDHTQPRIWYYALTDYGAALGRRLENPNRKSAGYHRQGPFEGSKRQIRSTIVRALLARGALTLGEIELLCSGTTFGADTILRELQRDGLVQPVGDQWCVAFTPGSSGTV